VIRRLAKAGARTGARGRGATIWLLLWVGLALALRLSVQDPESTISSDGYQYLTIARSLAAGHGFASGGSEHPDLSRPPLLPLLIAALSFLAPGVEAAGRWLMAVSGALATVPLFFLTRRYFGPGAALAVAPLAALACLAGTSVRTLPTEPFVLLSLLAAALVVQPGRGAGRAAVAGALAGLAALTRGEGLVWPLLLALIAVVTGPSALRLRPSRAGLGRAAMLLAVSLAVYSPYVVWASVRLGRFEPAPSIAYLGDMRDITDRYGLRHVGTRPIPWDTRVVGLLSADHTRRVLDAWFTRREALVPDPSEVGRQDFRTSDGTPAQLSGLAQRRFDITLSNLWGLPTYLHGTHFLPVVPAVAWALGCVAALRRRRSRRGLACCLLLGAGACTPVLSHVEPRFFYLPFALALPVAAAGWSFAHRLGVRAMCALRLPLPSRRALAVAAHGVVVLLLARTGRAHAAELRRPPVLVHAEQEAGRQAARIAGTGRILALQPYVPWDAQRDYGMLPVGGPETVLAWARVTGATAMVIEGTRDAARRPGLDPLVEGDPVPGFTLEASVPDPRGGNILIFRLSPQEEAPSR
jgi:dolichyl-phosphate-mannose-protein mannosyltransferase